MIKVPLSYSDFKTQVTEKGLDHVSYLSNHITVIVAFDRFIAYTAIVDDDDLDDYNTTLAPTANKKIGDTISISPFADKAHLLFDGQGTEKDCSVGVTNIDFSVPSGQFKVDAVEIINGSIGDRVQLQILDDANGTYSGAPSTLLNQFGTNWNMKNEAMSKHLPYEATLYQNMVVRIVYDNRTIEKTIFVNLDLHKVV